jgi:hypothetical protein
MTDCILIGYFFGGFYELNIFIFAIKDLIFGIVLLIIHILCLYFNNKLNFNIIIKSLIEKKYNIEC